MENDLDDTRVDRQQRRSWPGIFAVACSSGTARIGVYSMSRILLHQWPEVQAARGKRTPQHAARTRTAELRMFTSTPVWM